MPRDGPDNASAEPASLPRLRLNPATPPPPPPSGAALPPHAAAPSAWQGAFEEASLLSPMASGAFGRSFSLKVSPLARSELRLLEEAEEAAGRWHAAATELRSLCRLALPISVTNLSAFCIGLVILSMVGRLAAAAPPAVPLPSRHAAAHPSHVSHAQVGRLGSFELSAAVLATTCFNVTGLSILSGFAAAMETFCGQAYGAQNYRLVGVVFQRALLLVTLLSALVALLWTQAEALLLAARCAGRRRGAGLVACMHACVHACMELGVRVILCCTFAKMACTPTAPAGRTRC